MEKLGFTCNSIDYGRVDVSGLISTERLAQIRTQLLICGLELLDNKKFILIERIKSVINELIHNDDIPIKINFSNYLTHKLKLDYTYLANLFSKEQGITVEQFMIMQKIERVKKFLVLNELNLTEISWKMHYSSVGHLSAQFKKVTGESPSYFKQQHDLKLAAMQEVLCAS
ncbi:helix-turn-helix domain-containing protein [Mucilaginibacter antarcticus]|uniref:helix-turn-helix domain-containing protein n=1 Tax=Mucilaginibacter antarcticus TaxID=1855725 RepID=UPI003645E841